MPTNSPDAAYDDKFAGGRSPMSATSESGGPVPGAEPVERRSSRQPTRDVPPAAWNAEQEGNKLILLFEGFLYGDQSVSEGMVLAAINRFRTKQPIELNADWEAARE